MTRSDLDEIQRYREIGRGTLTYDASGAYVRYDDISALLPAENTDWEPCEIAEATHVLNANGETFNARPVGADLDIWIYTTGFIVMGEVALRAACLTPVRKRKIEPVVFEAKKSSKGIDMYEYKMDLIPNGSKVRVTVEVLEEA